MTKLFNNKNVLITGGTGSFGRAVLSRLLKLKVKNILIFSRDEKKQEDLRFETNNSKVRYILGDVRNFESIKRAMKNVDYVFHAAALKQVPTCDFNPQEAYLTNVQGTINAVDAAIENKVKKLVFLSTDKAVYPINAMGISKALAEKIVQAKARELGAKDTVLCITRYGNVMSSRASVIPRFIELIKTKQNITLTDKRMTRFLMSLDESIELVFYAFKNGKQGDIFVQKSPSCNIYQLANVLKKIYKSKSQIKIIGTRHGEKLYETLVSREEMVRSVSKDKYFNIKLDNRDLNYDLFEVKGNKKLNFADDYNSNNTNMLSDNSLEKLLKKTVLT
jgi:UDP-N-acetylglucosamine 4,6-dehydratase